MIAVVIALIAEVDARRLYLSEGYSSLQAFCIERLGFAEDATKKRIQAARAAQEFPRIITELAKGRLHLSGVCLITPHLIRENADQLISAALSKTKSEIEQMLAERFPQTESMPLVQPILLSSQPANLCISKNQVTEATRVGSAEGAPGHLDVDNSRARVKPIAAERFELRFMISKATNDKLRYVQELASHQIPSGDVGEVFDRALDAYQQKLEKRKFAATARPRKSRPSSDPRHIPAHVMRAVRERDQWQRTFVGENGHRCSSRRLLWDPLESTCRHASLSIL